MIRVLVLSPFTYFNKYLLTGESLYFDPKEESQLKELKQLFSVGSSYKDYLAPFDESGIQGDLIKLLTNPIEAESDKISIKGVDYIEEIKNNTSAQVDDVQRLENYLTPPQEAKENIYIKEALEKAGIEVEGLETEKESSPNTSFLEVENVNYNEDFNKVKEDTVEKNSELEEVVEELKELVTELEESAQEETEQEVKVYKYDELKEMHYTEVQKIAESMGLTYITKAETISLILDKQKINNLK